MKTISTIAHIQPFVQEYAETITDILDLYVTIIDEDGVRIGGTGPYADTIGRPIPGGSFFREVLASGQAGFIYEADSKRVCQNCDTCSYCRELATMGFPIRKQEQIVGVIGVVAFTVDQRERLAGNSAKFRTFLSHMSSLLESKLLMLDNQWRLQNQVHEVLETVNQKYTFGKMIGRDRDFVQLLQKAQRVAISDSTILIQGESGTGKELLARAIHDESGRKNQPFVVVNCPSIPENLLESELFGYEPGAFTGANKSGKKGKFELADKGTIFLDEIGDLPLTLQPKLLRVIQERSIERLAGSQVFPVDVRIIAATNRDLEQMVREGAFREDLYYRLHVIPLLIPPLRRRMTDVPLYIEHFLGKFSKSLQRGSFSIDDQLRHWLMNYSWPGNVRQLEHVVECLVTTAKGNLLSLQELPANLLAEENAAGEFPGLEQQIAAYEKQLLIMHVPPAATLADKKQAAKILKISLATLYRKLEKYHLS